MNKSSKKENRWTTNLRKTQKNLSEGKIKIELPLRKVFKNLIFLGREQEVNDRCLKGV